MGHIKMKYEREREREREIVYVRVCVCVYGRGIFRAGRREAPGLVTWV